MEETKRWISTCRTYFYHHGLLTTELLKVTGLVTYQMYKFYVSMKHLHNCVNKKNYLNSFHSSLCASIYKCQTRAQDLASKWGCNFVPYMNNPLLSVQPESDVVYQFKEFSLKYLLLKCCSAAPAPGAQYETF